jgi:hypothetical protein
MVQSTAYVYACVCMQHANMQLIWKCYTLCTHRFTYIHEHTISQPTLYRSAYPSATYSLYVGIYVYAHKHTNMQPIFYRSACPSAIYTLYVCICTHTYTNTYTWTCSLLSTVERAIQHLLSVCVCVYIYIYTYIQTHIQEHAAFLLLPFGVPFSNLHSVCMYMYTYIYKHIHIHIQPIFYRSACAAGSYSPTEATSCTPVSIAMSQNFVCVLSDALDQCTHIYIYIYI